MDPSTWLRGPISKEEAALAVMEGGGVDGSFNVRAREGNEKQFALCVVYKGKPTHHLIQPNEEGFFTANKKQYGDHTNINDFVNHLGQKQAGWPVVLAHPKGTNNNSNESETNLDSSSTPPSWLHGQISKEEIAETLKPWQNGKFAIREHMPDSWALCVIYKEKPTHHQIVKNDEGILTVNRKPYGGATTLPELVKTLSAPNVAGWPVQLIVPKGNAVKSKSPKRKSSSNVVLAGAPAEDFLHAAMTKDEAAALLKSQGAGTDGSFFIRDRGEGYPDEYVMCVIYRGNPTHHLIVKKDGVFFINRKPTDESKTLSEMVEYLRAPGRPNWPVPLKDHVPNGNANTEEPLPPRPSSSSKPISKPTSRQTSSSSNSHVGVAGGSVTDDFLHDAMTKDEAGALLKSQGAGTDGSFFIRDRGEGYPDEYVMCVIYRGNPTHHLIVKKDGVFFINKKSTDGSKTLSEMVEYLRAPGRPNWPVPLKDHVPNGNANAEEPPLSPPPQRPSKITKPTSEPQSQGWLHGLISREEIEALLAPLENGKFAIREREEGAYSMCVVYKGRATHHMIKQDSDHFTVNNKRYGNAATLDELVKFLSQPNQPGWPVQLILETSKVEPEEGVNDVTKPQTTSTPQKIKQRPPPLTLQTPKEEDVGYMEVEEGYVEVLPAANYNSRRGSDVSTTSNSSTTSPYKSDGLANLSNEQLIAHVRALKAENQRLRQLGGGGSKASMDSQIQRLRTPNLALIEDQRDSIEILCTQVANMRSNLFAKELDRVQESAWLETQAAQLTSQWLTIKQLEQHAETGTRSFTEQIDRVRAGIKRLQVFWEGQEESRVKRSEWIRDELHEIHTHSLTLQSGLASQETVAQKQQMIRLKSNIETYKLKMAHVQKLTTPAQKLIFFGAGAADC